RLAHARLRARKRARDARVSLESVVGPPRALQRARIEKMAVGRMKVRRATLDLLERCDRVVRAAEIEQRARLADEKSRFVSERLGTDRLVMLERFLRLADLQAFLGESAPVGDRVDDVEFPSQGAISSRRIESGGDRPARSLRRIGTEPLR